MKTFHLPVLVSLLLTANFLTAQVTNNLQLPTSVNSDGAAPAASAMLDVSATDKGMLVPRMTSAQRTAIASPATGLLVFDTTTGGFWFYNGTAWVDLAAPKTLADADNDTKIQVEESPDEDIIRFDVAGTEAVKITSDGKVTIGTDTPEGTLTVNGSVEATSLGVSQGTTNLRTMTMYGGSGDQWINFRRGGNPTGNAGLIFSDHAGEHHFLHNSGNSLDFKYSTESSEDPSIAHGSIATRLSIRNSDGNVGIGTNNPASKLDVEGGIGIGATYSGTSAAPTNGAIIEGNVGIGVTLPKQTLHVAGDYYGRGHLHLYAYEGDGLSGNSYIQARDDSGTSSIDMVLRTQSSGSITEAMRLKSNGNVGIGTSTPASSAVLDIQSTNKGILVPRMTAVQRGAIVSPTNGLLVFDTTWESFWYFRNGNWNELATTIPAPTIVGSVSHSPALPIPDNSPVGVTSTITLTQSGTIAWNTQIKVCVNITQTFDADLDIFLSSPDGTMIVLSSDNGSNGNHYTNACFVTGTALSIITGDAPFTGSWQPEGFFSSFLSKPIAGPWTLKLIDDGSAASYGELNSWSIEFVQASTATSQLSDRDNDTKIHVEKSIDEDIIRFDLGGVENMVLRKNASGYTRLELLNTNHNTFVGQAAGIANNWGSYNTAFGSNALVSNMTGFYNTASGRDALYANSTGNNNTAIGMLALVSNTTGDFNTAVGYNAGVLSGNLNNATAIGYNAKVSCSNCMALGGTGADAVKVGIGTTSPQAPLHVTGNSGDNSGGTNIIYFNSGVSVLTSSNNWQGSTTIFANGNICATQSFISGTSFNFSDARIKHIIGRSDAAADLDRLNRIEITRYTYLDSLAKGSAVQTKVVAQQLKAVMPEAVSFTQDYLPDVMQVAQSLDFKENEKLLTVTLPRPHGLSPGDRIKCLDEKGAELFAEVLTAPTENSLTFRPERQPARLFVYGKQVNDFHVVDYDAISMLNVSATQELSRKLTAAEQRVAALEAQLKQEKSDNAARLDKITAALAGAGISVEK